MGVDSLLLVDADGRVKEGAYASEELVLRLVAGQSRELVGEGRDAGGQHWAESPTTPWAMKEFTCAFLPSESKMASTGSA